MRSIIELKKDILFNREMTDLIDILKKTAISQFQSLFNRRKLMTVPERYTQLMEMLFNKIDFAKVRHPLFTNPTNNVLVVLITSDMGFLGGLNSDIIETTLRSLGRKDNTGIFVIGEKGKNYLSEMNKSFSFLPGIPDDVKLSEAERAGQSIFAKCIRDKIGKVIIGYPKFFSFAHQEISILQLLPRQTSSVVPNTKSAELSANEKYPETAVKTEQIPNGISSMKKSREGQKEITFGQVIYEPFMDKVTDYLARKWLVHKIYDIFWHSKLSEFAARATHLEGSTKELQDIRKSLEFQYFRNKREITDRTIRDIFGGKIAANRMNLKKLQDISL